MFTSIALTGLVISHDVFADEPLPTCSSGIITGDNLSSTFQITLNCSNISQFVSSGGLTADSADNSKIILQTAGHAAHNPKEFPTVSPSESLMTFYYTDGASIQSLSIAAGTLLNSSGSSNTDIILTSDDFIDKALPYGDNDYYGISGNTLNITADSGVLANDIDQESGINKATLESNALNGTVTLNDDGSFFYQPNDGYVGGDQFTYRPIDNAGNAGNIAAVNIYDAPATITTSFNKIGGNGHTKYAKVGDTVRVEFSTDEPVTPIAAVIAGHSLYDIQTIDSTHFYCDYVMQSSDNEGVITFSVTVKDLGENYSTATTEDGIIFDKTPPVVYLNSDSEQYYFLKDTYTETATANDNVDGDISAIASESIDTNKSGTYVIIYNATDTAGNEAAPVTRTVYVIDNIAPTVTIDKPQSAKSGDIIKLTGTIDETNSSLVLTINGKAYKIPSGNIVGTSWFYYFDTSFISVGKYTLKIVATDPSGNISEATTTLIVTKRKINPVSTPSANNIVYYPIVTSGANSTASSDVLGAKNTDKDNSPAPSTNTQESSNQAPGEWTLFGIVWYWWLVIGGILGIFIITRLSK
jgi:hypothetical protein